MADMGDIGTRKHVSQAALSSLLNEIKNSGPIGACSRQTIKRAREEKVDASTPFGKVVQQLEVDTVQGGAMQIPYAHPWALLHHALNSSQEFEAFVLKKMLQHDSSETSKWGIIFYSDEITPGNVLRHDNKRRVQGCYWSLRQYGWENMCCEALWFPLFTVRSRIVKRIKGDFGALVSAAMKSFFKDPHDGSKGITILGKLMFFDIDINTGDEGAIKISLDIKGASGILVCGICPFVTKMASRLEDFDESGTLVSIAEFDTSKLSAHTDDSFRQTVAYVNSQKDCLPKAEFDKLEKCNGINFCPCGVVATLPMFRPISTLMYDWSHVMIVSGLFNLEVGEMIQRKFFKPRDADEFLQSFTWPKKASVTGKTIFSKISPPKKKAAGQKSATLKADASECLGAYAVLQVFMMTQLLGISPLLDKVVECFSLLCEILDMLRCATLGIAVSCNKLHEIMAKYLNMHKEIYEHVIPKHHYALHLAPMLQFFGGLISCLVHERMHRLVKRIANDMRNTSGLRFEKSVLLGVLNLRLQTVRDPSQLPSDKPYELLRPQLASEKITNTINSIFGIDGKVMMSNEAMAGRDKIAVGDVVFAREGQEIDVGAVMSIFELEEASMGLVILNKWQPVGDGMFNCNGETVFIDLQSVVAACIYRKDGENAFVIPPFQAPYV